ncbi:Pentapeptide repeats containing protein [Halomicronema hongdechloris C2206]|uniref:Pentapeptide repeats containing protein n=1 Tax=Halomicronema hongdechloris C2206 TaxID=1641165 RepID=A0A1Z3HFX4_9CYAN|nr:pentapeptide repeat-containing protein [Halomicronema hongdechloris]ASC69186.1 Pentapeptide repeats containing protein [Halomicronema hongdechloris C2206]
MSRNALIVGINPYHHLTPLKAPATDAEAIAQRLEGEGEFRVKRLPEVVPDGKPTVSQQAVVTLAELKKALVELFNPGGNQYPDTALLYFSGHGLRDQSGIVEGYLASSDADPEREFFGLSLTWLRRLLEESPVRQQIIWLDCCHSGALLDFAEADPGDRGGGRDRNFIAASRNFELAYEDLGSDHSVLTRALLEGLDPGRLGDRWVTNLSLTDFITETLKRELQTPICNNSGEPINLTRRWQATAETTATVEDTGICPYKGLSYFDWNSDDPNYFYGRQTLTDELLDHVRTDNFLAITGASGSGKSSVLRAGLLHQLQQGRRIFGSDRWEIRLFLPGDNPCQNLAAAFIDEGITHIERAEQQGKAEALIKEGADGLRRLVQTTTAPRVVLVVDQFEEVFTLCQDAAERTQFFATLLGALEHCGDKLCLIPAMRADFVGRCFEQDYSGLAQQVQDHLVAVKPMSREELTQAIEKPAQRVGLAIEPELVTTLLNDVETSPGGLPLMQYTLRELWNRRQENTLELKTYTQLAASPGTLKQRADEVYEGFSSDKQATGPPYFLEPDPAGRRHRRHPPACGQEQFGDGKHPEPLIDEVVKCLADANLVVTSELVGKGGREQGGGNRERVAIVDVAHEALIRNWPRLRRWLEGDRDLLMQQRKIELAADEWTTQNQRNTYLLEGHMLSDALAFCKKHGQELPISNQAEVLLNRSLRQRRVNWLKLSSVLILPLTLAYFILEPTIRRGRIQEARAQIRQKGPGTREAVEYVVRGCPMHKKLGNSLIPASVVSTIFGDCINLYSYDLSSADLSTANLSGADLSGADLSSANLSSANLSSANLSGADLSNANLSNANLYSSDLNEAGLYSANLSEADLSGADFNSANLSSADLHNAELYAAVLKNASLHDAKLNDANLSYANLHSVDLRNADLSNARLHSADLRFAFLRSADLSNSNLRSADLRQAYFHYANFDSAFLRSANFTYADLSYASLINADLSGVNLSNADLSNADLSNADLSNANLNEAFLGSVKFNHANLSDANLSDANLINADFQNTDLHDASLRNANLRFAYFLSTDLRSARNLIGSQLTGKNQPDLCNVPLPLEININKDRDCDLLPQKFDSWGGFDNLEEAKAYVEEARQKVWEE